MLTLPAYVLITPARNEAEFIELTIRSVVAQTVRPAKWVIVSDGSTDGTDNVVHKYAVAHPWIELVRMPERRERHFAGKVQAFNAGYAKMKDLEYEAIGSLDGDTSFDEDYFAFLLQKLADDPTLGLVGTPFKDNSNPIYDYRFVSIEHVSGFCQLFRRECFEEIEGYVPVRGGGVDLIAVIKARMKGWKTRTFTEKVCLHHRDMGMAQHGKLMAWFRNGVKDYALGCHPIWEFFRMGYQMTKRPFVVGGLLMAGGYVWGLVRRMEGPVSQELVAFRRREQMQRLKKFLTGKEDFPTITLRVPPEKPQSRLIPAQACSLSVPAGMKSLDGSAGIVESAHPSGEAHHTGLLIINADDWGRDRDTTDRTLECIVRGAVSSVSAMVFMEDSERAATIARERAIDVGLHLNFTTPLSAPNCPPQLVEYQRQLAAHLLRHPLARVFFHPWLARSFEYVVAAQLDEFRCLYGAEPERLDGHHHAHLCANILLQGLLPPGTLVRRNFSFQRGEKSLLNRLYRQAVDRMLARRHRVVDFFFSLAPLEPPGRLERIFSLARRFAVEVETHPVKPEEYRFLAEGKIFLCGLPIASRFAAPRARTASAVKLHVCPCPDDQRNEAY